MWHRDTKGAKAAGKVAPTDLLGPGWPQTYHVLKKRKAVSANFGNTRSACPSHTTQHRTHSLAFRRRAPYPGAGRHTAVDASSLLRSGEMPSPHGA